MVPTVLKYYLALCREECRCVNTVRQRHHAKQFGLDLNFPRCGGKALAAVPAPHVNLREQGLFLLSLSAVCDRE